MHDASIKLNLIKWTLENQSYAFYEILLRDERFTISDRVPGCKGHFWFTRIKLQGIIVFLGDFVDQIWIQQIHMFTRH